MHYPRSSQRKRYTVSMYCTMFAHNVKCEPYQGRLLLLLLYTAVVVGREKREMKMYCKWEGQIRKKNQSKASLIKMLWLMYYSQRLLKTLHFESFSWAAVILDWSLFIFWSNSGGSKILGLWC